MRSTEHSLTLCEENVMCMHSSFTRKRAAFGLLRGLQCCCSENLSLRLSTVVETFIASTMSLVDYGFYSDEEGEESVPGAATPSNIPGEVCKHGAVAQDDASGISDQHSVDRSKSDSEESCRSKSSHPPGMLSHIWDKDDVLFDQKVCRGPDYASERETYCLDTSVNGERITEDNRSEAEKVHEVEKQAAARELMARVPQVDPPKQLMATIERLQHLKRRGITVNGNINTSLDFKNPYLLEKIMKVFDIDPYCSNYPPEMYDRTKVIPFKLDNSDVAFYTYIGSRQEKRRQRREKMKEVKEAALTGPGAGSTPSRSGSGNAPDAGLAAEGQTLRRSRRTRFDSPAPVQGAVLATSIPSAVQVSIAVQQAAREVAKKVEARAMQQQLMHQQHMPGGCL